MTELDNRLQNIPLTAGSRVDNYRDLFLSGCALLDVRAPVEFNKGAFPTAVNLPLMSDEERHQVGIRYKDQGQDSAISLGAELVTAELQAQRVQRWADFVQKHPDARLYCFRGGLRSRITQQWLADAGVQIPLVIGGYKALRTFLIKELQRLSNTLSITLIGGRTGNGKTLLLNNMASTVDLEHLANHRGSSFGGMPDGQPRNIDFENAVSIALMQLENAGHRKVLLEDEARLIGRVCLPDTLRNAMLVAPIVILECGLDERIDNCFDDYVTELLHRYQTMLGQEKGFEAYAQHHRGSLNRIRKRFGGDNHQRSLSLLDEALRAHQQHGDTDGYRPFIAMLLQKYYDPMYDYQLGQKAERVVFHGTRQEILSRVKSEGTKMLK